MRRWHLTEQERPAIESGAQLALFHAAHRVVGDPNPAPYLLRAALNGAVNGLREEWGRNLRRPVLSDEWEGLVDPAPGPYEQTASREAVRELLDACDSDLAREAAVRRATGEAYQDIAAQLHVTERQVGRLLSSCTYPRTDTRRDKVEEDGPDAYPSPRQLEVLQLIADGLTNAEIGARLFLGEETVKKHVARILAKLQARSRAHAVAVGFRRDLLR